MRIFHHCANYRLADKIGRMRTQSVIKHFQTQQKTAEALGCAQSSVAEWKEFPPDSRQLQIEKLTGGVLRAEPGCLDRILGMDKLRAAV